eukprot:115892-Amphidinium_carterae.3
MDTQSDAHLLVPHNTLQVEGEMPYQASEQASEEALRDQPALLAFPAVMPGQPAAQSLLELMAYGGPAGDPQ